MSRLNAVAAAVLMVVLLATGCEKGTKTNVDPIPEPQSTATSVEEEAGKVETASGVYIGQIDSNSIEIKLDEKPEDSAYKAFAFSDRVRREFERERFKSNTRVNIRFIEREGQQALLLSLDKQ